MKIGWILVGNKMTPSARIQGYNMHRFLKSKGIYSKILNRPKRYNTNLDMTKKEIDKILKLGLDILVLLKIYEGKYLNYLITESQKRGAKVINLFCDKISIAMIKKTDATITNSRYYLKLVPKSLRHKMNIVFDGIEQPNYLVKNYDKLKQKIKLCYVTSFNFFDRFPCINHLPDNTSLTIIGPSKRTMKRELPGCKNFEETPYPYEYKVWSLKTVYKEILGCDIGIVPFPKMTTRAKIKSSNKILLFMSLGLPVIASPVPSYLPIIRQGKNGFIVKTKKEWIRYIEYLRDNPRKRKKIGLQARADVIDRYSKEVQGELYLKIFNKILKS